MEYSVKQRLTMFIKSINISHKKFEERCGLSNGYVNNIKNNIGTEKLQKILYQFPELNNDWLLTGEGEMIKGGNEEHKDDNHTKSTVKQRLILFLKNRRIKKTEFANKIGVSNSYITSMRKSIQPEKIERIALNFPDLNIDWLLTGEGEMLKGGTAIKGNGNMSNINSEHCTIESDKNTDKLIEIIRESQRQLAKKDEQIDKLIEIIGRKT